jgi:hypothetical protein
MSLDIDLLENDDVDVEMEYNPYKQTLAMNDSSDILNRSKASSDSSHSTENYPESPVIDPDFSHHIEPMAIY